MALTKITVTGSYPTGAGGQEAQGFVQFVPTSRIISSSGQLIIPQVPVQANLNQGAISLSDVYTTDNEDLEPQPWYWEITEYLTGAAPNTYSVLIPYNDSGTVDLSDLTPVIPGPVEYSYAQTNAANTFTEANTFDGPVAINDGLTIDDVPIANPPGGTTEYLRADGTWDVPTGGGGGTPSGTVTAQTSFGQSSTAGSATAYSRGDHAHGTPALPSASTSTPGVVQLDGTAADIQPLGTRSAGATGLAADAGHTHPATGVVLAADAATTVQPGTAYGTGTAVGTDTTYAREDHQHGTVSLT